jgi:hypothetical protein
VETGSHGHQPKLKGNLANVKPIISITKEDFSNAADADRQGSLQQTATMAFQPFTNALAAGVNPKAEQRLQTNIKK